MRGRRTLIRLIPLAAVLIMVAASLSGRPDRVARAISCVSGDGYETNNNNSETCALTPGTSVSSLGTQALFSATASTTFTGFGCPDFFDPCFRYDVTCNGPAVDEDWFSFSLQQGFTFTASVDMTGTSVSDPANMSSAAGAGDNPYSTNFTPPSGQIGLYWLQLYDSSNALIQSITGTTEDKSVSFTVPTTDTYKIRIVPVDDSTLDNACTTNSGDREYRGNLYNWGYNLSTVYTAPPLPVLTEDDYEQNDFAVAPYDLTLNVSIDDELNIFPAGDDDWFRFLGAPGNFTIEVGSGYGFNLVVQLFAPGASTSGPPTASATGTNPVLAGNFTQTGFYLLRIDTVTSTEQTPYTLNITNTGGGVTEDSYEQNDTIGTARLVSPPVSGANASIFPAGDPDFYVFAVNPGTINASVQSLDSTQYTIRVHSPTNTLLATAGPSVNPSIANLNATTAGNYKLEVVPEFNTQFGNYMFNISTTTNAGLADDPYEQNDNAGSTYGLTLPVNLTNTTIFPVSDPDFFRFFSNAGTATINIYPNDSNMRFTVNLVNPDGSANTSVTNVANPAINATLAQTGNYRIEIFETQGIAGGYTLSASYSQTTGPVAADAYEENDSYTTPRAIGSTDSLTPTIFPANDPDYFQFFATAGRISVRLFSQNSAMDFTMRVYGPDGSALQTSTGPNPEITRDIGFPGYYTVEILETTGNTGQYQLSVSSSTYATPTNMGTPGTAIPTPTYTPTPDMGGNPDIAEQNNNWQMAFRIAPGNEIGGLNFNGGWGVDDIDYFVMNVKKDIQYTCETYNLGLGTDTIMSIYGPTADTTNLIGTHDDVDSRNGVVRSKITWKSAYQGQVYIVIDQVGPLTYPGAATYDFACDTGTSAGGGSTTGGGGGGGGASGGTTGGSSASGSNALSVEIIGAPERVAPPEPPPAGTLMVNVLIAYDENANGLIDLQEGVLGMSVRAIDVSTNKQLSSGFTDSHGNLQLLITAPQSNDVMIVIPFLSVGKTFEVVENSTENWRVLLPSSLLPGLIP